MHIRSLRPNETALFRQLRLQALAESPNAFGETLQQAQIQPDAYWEKLTASVTQPDRHVMFLAEQAEQILGFAFGLLDRQDATIGHIGGMWVNPAFRSSGVGSTLLAKLLDWAHQREFRALELWVTEGNEKAVDFYQRSGFVYTGKRDLLPSNPSLQIIQMSLKIQSSESQKS